MNGGEDDYFNCSKMLDKVSLPGLSSENLEDEEGQSPSISDTSSMF
jgi:hypothetical protein